MIFALSAPVLFLAIAIAIDYGRAAAVRTKLNAAADAAALAALTPAMLQQSNAVAQAAAEAMFNAEASAITTLVSGDTQVTVTVTNPTSNATVRTVVVNYSAENATLFAGVLNVNSIGLSGTSTAQASIPPNINFYLLLDNSPSMQLPATSAGITQMQTLTAMQDGGNGCAFACHQVSTNNGDTEGNKCSDGSSPTVDSGEYCASINSKGQAITQIDNYQVAVNNGITLRLDELNAGVTALMTTASNTASSGQFSTPPKYQFAAYEIDSSWSAAGPNNTELMALTSNYVSAWSTDSANFGVMLMYSNNNACANSSCTSGTSTNDEATNYDNAMSSINSTMPNPGNGTNQPGDTPQEVLFFVTDGVEDEGSGGSRLEQPINWGTSTNYCTTIKNRGIKIAILYTQYLAVPANSWYETYIAPILPDIAPQLQACASPGLFYQAAIGDNLGTDLTTLFQAVVQSATLTN